MRNWDQVKLGPLLSAGFATKPPQFASNPVRLRGARRLGKNYERDVLTYLGQLFPDTFIASPWLLFQTKSEGAKPQWCQPDALVMDIARLRLTIIEVKYRHCAAAYWQTKNLYSPVLRHILGKNWQFRFLEVVKWYDPAEYFPVDPILVSDPALPPAEKFGVHIWKK